MDNLQDLKEKAVRSMEQNDSGHNSYLIIKFTDDSKLTISSFPYNDKGSGRLEIDYADIKMEEIKNRKVLNITEELDSDKTEKLIITFKNGGEMIIRSYNVIEDGTAGLETSIYISNAKKVVAESLDENEYKDGRFGNYIMNQPQYEEEEPENENKNNDMKKFVDENIDEFAKYDEGPGDAEEIATAFAPKAVEDDEMEDQLSGASELEELSNLIDHELSAPEFSRGVIQFRLKGGDEMIEGIPMAKMAGGSAILFKTQNGLRKVVLDDMIVESEEPRIWVKESLEGYE